ncbi:hypothetical protein SDC9_182344 [bioreactor metagenome]|uniref:Uncharacterized protein n=1 Tax=bioreactor metagenome TaxID=1076179 RepID=A0A645H841_9ZZZZ
MLAVIQSPHHIGICRLLPSHKLHCYIYFRIINYVLRIGSEQAFRYFNRSSLMHVSHKDFLYNYLRTCLVFYHLRIFCQYFVGACPNNSESHYPYLYFFFCHAYLLQYHPGAYHCLCKSAVLDCRVHMFLVLCSLFAYICIHIINIVPAFITICNIIRAISLFKLIALIIFIVSIRAEIKAAYASICYSRRSPCQSFCPEDFLLPSF